MTCAGHAPDAESYINRWLNGGYYCPKYVLSNLLLGTINRYLKNTAIIVPDMS